MENENDAGELPPGPTAGSAPADPGVDGAVEAHGRTVHTPAVDEDPIDAEVDRPMVRIAGLYKSYDTKIAVDNIDLRIDRGSVYGLIGPNGAGKTTTLKMIATLIKPDEGVLEVCGYDATTDARSVRRHIGYMPDAFGTFRGLSCDEYLHFFARAVGLAGTERRDRVEGVIELTDLGLVRDRLTSALSTGQKQRLALAKTILHDPDLLILDEPASGLDPRARIEIRSLLRELCRMGKTVIISSHILADLEEICTDVAIIEEGAVVWAGALDEARRSSDSTVAVSIRVAEDDAARAVDVLKPLDEVIDVSDLGAGRLEAKVRAGEGNRLLAALLSDSLEIVAFSQKTLDLEALFLERTRGVVS